METLKLAIEIITGIGIVTTFVFNLINLRKILKDNEPQLIFDLRNFHGDLILTIKNTGKTKATNIKVNIKKIRNNGDKILKEDFLFCIPFELSTNEQTQGKIAFYGGTFYDKVFPYIDIEVSYKKPHKKKEVMYDRQVFFNPQAINELDIISDSINNVSKELKMLKYDTVRLANYFDGHILASFDEIDFALDKHFQNDLFKALDKKQDEIINRDHIVNNLEKVDGHIFYLNKSDKLLNEESTKN